VRIFIIPFFVLLFACPVCIAGERNPNVDIKHIGVETGLSQNQANDIVMDADGFLWIATWDGLNRYDGYDFNVFKPKPFDSTSISGNFITSLFVDSENRLWVGTASQGLNLFLPETQSFFRIKSYPNKDSKSLSNNTINKITEDDQGNIWVATDFGLNKLEYRSMDSIEIETYYFHHFDERNKINKVNDIKFLDDKKMIIACGEGLILFEPGTDLSFSFNRIIVEFKFPTTTFGEVIDLEIFQNRLLGGGASGLFVFDIDSILNLKRPLSKIGFSVLSSQISSFFSYKEVDFIEEDEFGNLWIGTTGHGLFLYEDLEDKGKKIDFGSSLTGQDVIDYRCFLHDPRSDVFWIGTGIDGLKKLAFSTKPFENFFFKPGFSKSIANSSVFSVEEDEKQNIWIGTLMGFSILDSAGTVRNFRELQSPSDFSELTQVLIYSILEDLEGNIWMGTQKGLFKIDHSGLDNISAQSLRNSTTKWPLSNQFSRSNIPPEVFDIFEDDQGQIWVGTGEGLIIIDPGALTTQEIVSTPFETKGLNAREVKSFFEDREGNIWLSSNTGFHMAQKGENGKLTFSQISNEPKNRNSLCTDQVNAVFQDSKGRFWIATKLGLNKMVFKNRRKIFNYYGKKEGLTNEFVYSILEDDEGMLWMSTNKGIVEFDPEKETFRNFDYGDGVQGNEFNQGAYLRSKNGKFYFGGLGGLTRFLPSDIKLNTNLPNTLVTGVHEGGELVSNLEALKNSPLLEFSYDQNDLQFKFVGLEFKNPEKNQYSYILEGLDKRWTTVYSKKSVDYPGLMPGNYVFKVMSSNNDGVWNTQAAEVRFSIIPPFWEREIFYLAMISAFLLSIYLIYQNRIRKKLKYLMTVEDIRQKENEEVRKKAAADFHDEMGHYLTRISVLSELLKNKLGENKGDLSNLVERIGDQSRHLYQGTRDFIWTFDPKTNNFFEVGVRLKDFGDDLFQESSINFHSDVLESSWRNIQIPSDVCRQVVLLFKESMNNAAKHSKASNVYLKYSALTDDDNAWELIVEDDGVGLSESGKISGKGFESMLKRASKTNLDLSVIERAPSGLKIILSHSGPFLKNEKNIA
jgi:ligand-binding sensor domain-containing protein/signal transduction histidine kinase